MEFSAHAMQRCHQRGIRPIQAQWLVDFGIRTWNRGAQVYFFNRASLSRLLERLAARSGSWLRRLRMPTWSWWMARWRQLGAGSRHSVFASRELITIGDHL